MLSQNRKIRIVSYSCVQVVTMVFETFAFDFAITLFRLVLRHGNSKMLMLLSVRPRSHGLQSDIVLTTHTALEFQEIDRKVYDLSFKGCGRS